VNTYKTLTLGEAHAILDAAQKKAEELGIPEVLCVADNAGYPIALRRLDGGKVTSVQIAMNKAFTAAGHRKPTHNYKNALPGEEAFGIFTQHEGRFTVFVGRLPDLRRRPVRRLGRGLGRQRRAGHRLLRCGDHRLHGHPEEIAMATDRASLSKVVSEKIRGQILAGRLKPGERLVEDRLYG